MRNRSGLFVMMIGVLLIFGVGYIVFNSFVGDVSGPSSSPAMNVSMDAGNTIFNIGGIFLVVIVLVAVVGLVYYRVSTPERYKKFSKIIEFFDTTTYYFGWGLLSFLAIVIPGYLLWLLFQYTIVEGRTGALTEVGKWVLIGILMYFVLAGLGYVVKKKIVDNWRARRKERKDEEIASGLDKTLG